MGVAKDYAGQGCFVGKVLIGLFRFPHSRSRSLITLSAEQVEIVNGLPKCAGSDFLRAAMLMRAQGRGEEPVAERGFLGRHAAGGGS